MSQTPQPTCEPPDEAPTEDPRPDGLRGAPSLVVVNTGNGKGKSSSAIGMIIRSVGRDWKVAMVQFLKSGKWHTGEEKVCRSLGVDWWALGEGFTWDSEDLTVDEAVAAEAWQHAKAVIQGGEHHLVVLDEVTYPLNWGWIDEGDFLTTIRERPSHVNVICTGRNASDSLIEIADTVSEMGEVKHAYQAGIRAKRGIDY